MGLNWAKLVEANVGRKAYIRRDREIAEHLDIPAAGHGMTYCPGHDDRMRSLSFRWTDEGRLLLNCFAGCTWEQITG